MKKIKIPATWKNIELNEICDLQNGYAFKSSDYVPFSNTLNCRMSNIRPNGEFDLQYHPKFLPDSYAEKYSSFLLKDDDVIIAMTDMATDAKILGVPTVVSTFGKNLLLNQRVGKLIIKHPELIYFPYLKYALNRESTKKYYLRFAGGGLQLNLGKSDLLSVKIPLPPLEEQKRIAAILDKADRVRRKRQEAIRLTEELGRSIFLDMFGDPVTNPKGWKVEKLEDFAMIQSGIAKGKKIKYDFSISIPYMRVANVQDGYIDLTEIKELTVSLEDSKKYSLSKGDLLLTEGGDPDKLGRGSVWYGEVDPCIHQNHIFCVRPNLDISKPEFLSKLIGSERGKKYFLRAAKQTTGIATINKTQLKAFPALIPPIELQESYVDKLKSIQNANIRFSQSYQESENLFNSLLQRAFRGEL